MKASMMVGRVAAAALTGALLGCEQKPSPSPDSTSAVAPGPTPRAKVRPQAGRALQLAWLSCLECSGGELKAVVNLGHSADSAATIDSLGLDLRNGPSSTRRANVQHQFNAAYTQDSIDALDEGTTLPLTRTQYVKPLLNNFINTYRVRAARALSEIGGPGAKATLDSAMNAPLPPGDTLSSAALTRIRIARDSAGP